MTPGIFEHCVAPANARILSPPIAIELNLLSHSPSDYTIIESREQEGLLPMPTKPNLKGMNVLIFMTDQQRAIQHFPPGWAKKNLPGDDRLMKHGLTFQRAFCNACMCSPSRATFMTGYFPAQHGVKWTLEQNMPDNKYPQQEMPLHLPNPATVMASAGYSTPYKGKIHLTKPCPA